MKKVKDFMNSKVIYFKPEDSIFKVAKVFSEKNISGAPVVENEKVIGVISETDVIKFLSLKHADSHRASVPISLTMLFLDFLKLGKSRMDFKKEIGRISKIKVKDMMSKKIISISPEATLLEAAGTMEKYDVNRLPVIENERIVGIIARADLIRALIE